VKCTLCDLNENRLTKLETALALTKLIETFTEMKVDHHFVGHFYSPERLLPPPLHWPRTQPGKEDVSSRSENFWWRMDGEDELDSVGPRRKRKKPIVVESAGSRGIWGTVPGYEYQPDIHQCQPVQAVLQRSDFGPGANGDGGISVTTETCSVVSSEESIESEERQPVARSHLAPAQLSQHIYLESSIVNVVHTSAQERSPWNPSVMAAHNHIRRYSPEPAHSYPFRDVDDEPLSAATPGRVGYLFDLPENSPSIAPSTLGWPEAGPARTRTGQPPSGSPRSRILTCWWKAFSSISPSRRAPQRPPLLPPCSPTNCCILARRLHICCPGRVACRATQPSESQRSGTTATAPAAPAASGLAAAYGLAAAAPEVVQEVVPEVASVAVVALGRGCRPEHRQCTDGTRRRTTSGLRWT